MIKIICLNKNVKIYGNRNGFVLNTDLSEYVYYY